MRLIIIRHGESLDNKRKVFQGQSDSSLSNLGIAQAKKLAKRLKDEKIDEIYSSDLIRAKQTAEEILKYHKDSVLVLDQRIRERHFGELQGKPHSTITNWEDLPKSVETERAMLGRVEEFFNDLYSKHKDKTVLVVCHGGVKRRFFELFFTGSEKIKEFEKAKNTSITEYKINESGNHELIIINCTKHLE
jgi:2,3-bisphosphoglycerate-dependent phosphoglycerate mutase